MENHNYVTWTLIIVGWAFLIWNSNRISKRSEIRSACDRLIRHLFDFKDEYFIFIKDDEFKPQICSTEDEATKARTKCEDFSVHLESRINLHSSLAEQLNTHLLRVTGIKPVQDDLFIHLSDDCITIYEQMFKQPNEGDISRAKVVIQRTINDYITSAVASVEDTYINHYAKTGFFKAIKNELSRLLKAHPILCGAGLALITLIAAYQVGLTTPFIEECISSITQNKD